MAINEFEAFAFASSAVEGTALTMEDLGLSADDIGLASKAWVTSTGTDPVNYRIDGETVVAGAGHIVSADITFIEGNSNIVNFSCIRASGTSASVAVTLFK